MYRVERALSSHEETGSGATSLFKLDKRDAAKLIAAKGSTYRHVEIRSVIM